ncbi:DUF4174 domain-containing protein [Ovoidimarina sediminis]|uniref:DUF4174 domain-containing protein n=1 Tax=Ovoidimarina sediminis TaxID=3079856 RepID=UPI00290B0916|nr:DUF4174 domain-containing protein [Rhodophyticola sp. MJ-SS7]MDU8943061.1 DUF4174 domain-containing protein [Rhodophyticola sp. MJ-SS7]
MTVRILLILGAFLIGAVPALATDGSTDKAGDPVAMWLADPATHFTGSEVDIEAFKWIARPVVVFADTPADPAFQEQIELLDARIGALVDRDVVVITDTDPAARSELRRKLRPRGFMLAIIGKDGGVKLRKPLPWDVREISRSIDKMPLRKQEIRTRAQAAE